MRLIVASFLWAALPLAAAAHSSRIHRSAHARAEFKHVHPCPANGNPTGRCPGWVIDHVIPLKRGGADDPANMEWQTKEAATAKDKWE